MLAERVKEWKGEWKKQGTLRMGEAKLLLMVVELQFGAQDEAVRLRIANATSMQLERWGERILTASSIAEMFGKR